MTIVFGMRRLTKNPLQFHALLNTVYIKLIETEKPLMSVMFLSAHTSVNTFVL
jgi:hypothetical protein